MYGLILFMMKVFVDGDNLCLIFNSIFHSFAGVFVTDSAFQSSLLLANE
jgi:hypothetical protein